MALWNPLNRWVKMSIILSQKLTLAEGTKLNSHNVKSSDPERRNQWSDSSEYASERQIQKKPRKALILFRTTAIPGGVCPDN